MNVPPTVLLAANLGATMNVLATALLNANLVTEEAAAAVLLQKEQEENMWSARERIHAEADRRRMARCRKARKAKR